MQSATSTVDPAEVAKFEAMAAEWWNPHGKFKPLHMMNPVRLGYIAAQIAAEFGRDLTNPAPFGGLRILDIGCGGTTAEALAAAGEAFDVVLAMEIVEHVADPQGFLSTCQSLMKPGGLIVASTINRNPKSFMMAIVGAEWVMRWLPKGTHEWAKFITPEELERYLRSAGIDPVDRKGFVFNPVTWTWAISDRDLSVNYVMAGVRRP